MYIYIYLSIEDTVVQTSFSSLVHIYDRKVKAKWPSYTMDPVGACQAVRF